MAHLLIELLSEEIPARMQARAAADLKQRMTDGLVAAGLTYASAGAFHTPRRLALSVEGVSDESPRIKEEKKGPALTAPDPAIIGYLKSLGIDAPTSWYSEPIATLREGGVLAEGLSFVASKEIKGKLALYSIQEYQSRPADAIVAEVLEQVVRNFPWPKSMRWGTGDLRWVRPLQSILCILSDEAGARVVDLTIDGIVAGNMTRGHRFLAPVPFPVANFEDYAAKLKRAFVVLSAQERAEHIWADATNQAFALGLEVVPDPALLAEVAGLVEWPVVLMGEIGADFLHLPPEVLQTSMREHQKFFSVRDPKTGQILRFVTVANRTTADDGATILAGNQKVLSARLSDARFFWDNDLRVAKSDLGTWVKSLENVTFHNKLGTVADRMTRVAALAREIAPMVGADPEQAALAASLAKADLQSAMVGEFPELQGLMGRYYIAAGGVPGEVAAVAQEHYAPLGPSDDVPTAPLSVAVALADKLDVLAGFWAIDEKPTGSKDPFALRRAALGVIRLFLLSNVRVNLLKIMEESIEDNLWKVYQKPYMIGYWVTKEDGSGFWMSGYRFKAISQRVDDDVDEPGLDRELFAIKAKAGHLAYEVDIDTNLEAVAALPTPEATAIDLLSFIHDRLKVYLRDQGIRHDIIDACLAMPGNDDLTLLVKRAEALSVFLKTDEGENLLQGFRRANNIVTQAEAKDGVEYSYGADVKFAETDIERALFAALDTAEAAIAPAMQAEDFAAAMSAMAALRAPIDGFFDAVQVNADSALIRRNRLNLLSRIRTLCLSVADLTRVEG